MDILAATVLEIDCEGERALLALEDPLGNQREAWMPLSLIGIPVKEEHELQILFFQKNDDVTMQFKEYEAPTPKEMQQALDEARKFLNLEF